MSDDVRIDWNEGNVIDAIDNATDRVMAEGAELVAETARRLVPVKSGRLKRSIRVARSKYKNGGYIILVGKQVDKKAYYAPFVELGTPGTVRRVGGARTVRTAAGRRRRRGRARRTPTAAKPFLRPALQANRRRIIELYRGALDK